MTDSVIVSRIIGALADYLRRDAATITEQHHLRDDLGLDSMAVIELLYKIEETFNIQIPDQDLTVLTTVGSVAAYVDKRLAPAKASPSAAAAPAPQPRRTPAAKATAKSKTKPKTPSKRPTSKVPAKGTAKKK